MLAEREVHHLRRVAVLAVVFAMLLTVFAAVPASASKTYFDNIEVTFNGHPVASDVPAQIMNGRTMLPFRAIFETLGATVSYEADTQTVTGVRSGTTVRMQIGNSTATVNGRPLTMDVAPVIMNNRTLVPVRFVAEALPGVSVSYDPVSNQAKVVDPSYPRRGGTLSIAEWSSPKGEFNPLVNDNSFYDSQITGMVFDGLFYLDRTLSPAPNLARTWDISDDNLTYTFKLRQGVMWHDGTPFTANDVKFTIEGIAAPGYLGQFNINYDFLVGYDAYHSGQASDLSGIKVIDDYTVSFTLKEVNASFFLNNLGGGIAPKHLYGNMPIADWGTANDPYNLHPIGTGPFMLATQAANQFYILERNPNYHLGAPYVDRIVWKVLPQEESIAYLGTGEVDLAEIGDYNAISTLQGYSNIRLFEYPNLTYQGMWMNNRENSVFHDKMVRQAAAYAVDRMSIINGLLKGHGSPFDSTIHPLMWAYDETVTGYEFDPDKARALLDAAGWVPGSDGVRVKNGQRLKIVERYPTGNTVRMAYASLIAKWLQDIGFEVELKKTDFATLIAASFDQFDYDITLFGYIIGSSEPDQLSLWGKDQIGPGLSNVPGWATDYSEELLRQGIAVTDQAARKEIYGKWQKHFVEEMPSLILYANNEIYATSTRFQNFKPAPGSTGHTWNVWEWWLSN